MEQSARNKLASKRVLSYRLLWFERDPPHKYPELALAAVTTHDLPTIAGLWTGADLEEQRQLRLHPNEKGMLEIRRRLSSMTNLGDDAPVEDIIKGAYDLLAQAPSAIIAATLEDALAIQRRPNLPGAPERSWSMALSEPLEQILSHHLVHAIAKGLRRRS